MGCGFEAQLSTSTLFFVLTGPTGQDSVCLRVADIPGLIDGAHQNRGLGHEFLRHVARTRVLVFVVDVAGSEGRSPAQDFLSLREELELYDSDLMQRAAFVVANKIDLPGEIDNHCGVRILPRAWDCGPRACRACGTLSGIIHRKHLQWIR